MDQVDIPAPGGSRRYKRREGAYGTVVDGGFKCEECGKVSPRQNKSNEHFRYYCVHGLQIRAVCEYCAKSLPPPSMYNHIRRCHPDKASFQWELQEDPDNDDRSQALLDMVIGAPEGKPHSRAGFLFCFDSNLRCATYTFEEVDKGCLDSTMSKRWAYWLTDKQLPEEDRISQRDVASVRSIEWNFGHLVCRTYHHHDPEEREATRCSSIGCLQHASVNNAVWSQLEIAFKFLCIDNRAFVFSVPICSGTPSMHGEYKQVAKPTALLKIAVVLTAGHEWFYDAYYVPNNESSTKSPNAYRLVGFEALDAVSSLRFLTNLRIIATQQNLFQQGNAAKHRWWALHPAPPEERPEELETTQPVTGDDEEEDMTQNIPELTGSSTKRRKMTAPLIYVAPKDVESAALRKRVAELEQELAAANRRYIGRPRSDLP